MAERHAGWVNGVDASEARLITGALTQAQGIGDVLDPLRVRAGLRDSGGFPGQVSLGTNKVTVNPFQAVLSDPARPGDGPYVVTMDAAKDLPFGAQHATLARIDLIVAEINSGVFAVTLYPGDPSASPVRPVVNGSPFLVLAELNVPRVGTPIPAPTDTRRFTAALNGILPVRNDTDLPPVAQAHGSQFIYRLDTGVLMVRKGSAWAPYRPPRGDAWHEPALQNGWVNYGAGYNDAAYTLTDDGWVRLRGLVKSGTLAKAIFTLPVGYRPVSRWLLGVSTNPDAQGRCDILPDGQVLAYSGNAGWFCLDDVTFSTY
jgi:hypothetical protein